MRFGFYGISYQKAPLAVRDKTSFTDSKKMDFMKKMEEAEIEQSVILSTCNRSEVYFFFETEQQKETVKRLYRDAFSEVDLTGYLQCDEGEGAYRHLFRVTSGFESLVLGEDQILGQVGDAADFSRTMGHSGKEMNKVMRDAVSCAKRIKTELKVSEKPLSVSYVGIRQLEKQCGIKGKTVLVIGSGKTSTLALTYLYEYGADKVYVCNRTLSHVKKLRDKFENLHILEYANRYEAIRECDIVVSATASPHLVVTADKLSLQKSVTFLDLATPRDVDVAVTEMPLVTLINLDSLQQMVKDNQKEREGLVMAGGHMVEESLRETQEWLRVSRMDGTIASLQQRCGDIVEDSYEYLEQKLDLNHREQMIVKKILNASLQRLLKEPIQELKNLDTKEKQDEYKKMIQHLFQI